jgi:hypothetical protein
MPSYTWIGTLLAAYLWYTDVMTRRTVLLAAALGTFAGFVFLAPIMPLELGGIINVICGTSALTWGVVTICSVIALALVVGRTFCGPSAPWVYCRNWHMQFRLKRPSFSIRKSLKVSGLASLS